VVFYLDGLYIFYQYVNPNGLFLKAFEFDSKELFFKGFKSKFKPQKDISERLYIGRKNNLDAKIVSCRDYT
jgi:hypothetical protein